MFTGSLIRTAYELTNNSDTKDKQRYEDEVNKLISFNRENKGTDLLTPLNFYLGILNNTNTVFFSFMNEEQKKQLLRNLQVTYLFLLAEKKYELEHQKTEHVKEYDSQLKKCQELIDALLYIKHCDEQQLQPAPEQAYTSEDKPVAYLGIPAGFYFAEQMVAIADRKTKTIKEYMGWVNEKRLYWVWGSTFLKTMLSLLPADFFYTEQAQRVVHLPDPYTGTMSWALYFFRFTLNLGLLMKHSIRGSWMSEVEKSEEELFKTQWNQRKFALLNDLVWAMGNLVCFFWLVGKGAAGTWGDMLTIGLLVFDITLAVWEFEEQRVNHNKQIFDYNNAIENLKQQIKKCANNQTLIDLKLAQKNLEKAREQCVKEWDYQKMNLATNIAYAVGLLLAFVLLTAPFFPFTAATTAAITLSGAVLCFAFSVINNAIKGGIEIHKTKSTVADLNKEQIEKIKEFKESKNENAKKLIFLEIEQLRADTTYQEKVIALQTMKLLHSIILESLIPAVAFVSLVFLPLGAGIGVLAAALALTVATHLIINTLFKAEKDEIKEFDSEEYDKFCDNPDKWNNKTTTSPVFFQSERGLTPTKPLIANGSDIADIKNSPPLEDGKTKKF